MSIFGIKTKSDIEKRCTALVKDWRSRDARFREWYKLIRMVDELEQEDMESFVGNDPRAAYNLSLHMLDMKIPHRYPAELVSYQLSQPASEVSDFLETAWADIYRRFRLGGKPNWQRYMIGLLLATGWTSVFARLDDNGCYADVINPIEVYPSWDDTLVEVAHRINLTKDQAIRLGHKRGWTQLTKARGGVKGYDYWVLDDTVRNIVILDGNILKDEPELDFDQIPWFIIPTGGLPDNGSITEDMNKYVTEVGQSFIATNENIYRSWNKWWTFSMQLLRDTAQPRWFEQSRSGQPILRPQDMFKRGAIFKGAPDDSVSPIPTPAIPIEMRTTQLDMEAMMQRGGMSWAVYGNVQQNLTAYVMAQITASASQVLRPYHTAIMDLFTDIDNMWLGVIKNRGYKPYDFSIPKEIPDSMRVTAEYELQIPGDLVQKATTARMLDPDFRLSYSEVMTELFPNVKDPSREMAKVKSDMAQFSPVAISIAMIEAYRQNAEALRRAKNYKAAMLFDRAADAVESQLSPTEPTTQPPISPRTEIAPRTSTAAPGTTEPIPGGLM